MAVSEQNYQAAWLQLKARYNKPRYITDAHVKRMIEYPVIIKPTAQEIRQLVNTFEEATRALQALGHETSTWDCWLIYIANSKLDSTSRQLWARHSAAETSPTFTDFISCLEERQHELRTLSSQDKTLRPSPTSSRRVAVVSTSQSDTTNCYQCGGQHSLYRCPDFLGLSAEQRKAAVQKANVCFNCLSSGHVASQCRSIKCKSCQGTHHTLLHDSRGSMHKPADHRFEAVAEYHINNNFKLPIRILLDTASEVSLISREAAEHLQLTWTSIKVPITGITNGRNMNTIGFTNFTLHSRNTGQAVHVNALIINKLLGYIPSHSIQIGQRLKNTNIKLADPDWYKPAPVDILLGAEPTLTLFSDQPAMKEREFTLRDTAFGWVVTGIMQSNHNPLTVCNVRSNDVEDNPVINRVEVLLRKFWELDSLETRILTPDESICEHLYTTTTTRDSTGRYMVKLPFKDDTLQLGKSRETALKRLFNLERRFDSNPELRAAYNQCMAEYLQLRHMSLVSDSEKQMDESRSFYIPHHAVYKPTSTTTKLRVVFDASVKSSTGISLNDTLLVGPTIQGDIFTILTRFRQFRVGMIADITKMYRQVRVDDDSANYQRILWRPTTAEPVVEYKMVTVTFGTASAPYQAVRTLHQIAQDEGAISKHAAEAIVNNFYVDDFLGGADNLDEASTLKNDITQMLERGGMELRGWTSNESQLTEQRTSPIVHSFDDAECSPVLGLQWDVAADSFTFNINLPVSETFTKRTFLANTSKVFDPLGFLAPVTIIRKVQFQQLWKSNIDWDDQIPSTVADIWKRVASQLKVLSSLRIQRFFGTNVDNIELIGFADASETAYAAVVYARSRDVDENGKFIITLVAAKTKVAPIKKMVTARLELCAADLLSKLLRKLSISLNIDLSRCFGFSDSQTVLNWLSDNPRRWKTFVANRTSNIIEIIPPERWTYVRSKLNPADCASRGMEPQQLMHHSLWWNGPNLLQQNIQLGWRHRNQSNAQVIAEARKVYRVTIRRSALNITDFSCLLKLLRITALCQRFIFNCRLGREDNRHIGPLTKKEVDTARITWIRTLQIESFPAEYRLLTCGNPLTRKHKLLKVDPFIDDDGLLRVRGRIENCNLSYNERHPIILHKDHHLTRLIVEHLHRDQLHSNFRLLQSTLARRYWIVGARIIIKQVVRHCTVCTRNRGKCLQQKMAPLPAVRVTPARPFLNCGVDYAGPIVIKSWRGRCSKTYKSYIALFVCLTTKAIHLEAVTELSTDCFLAALRRFISRRGVPENIFSDNGTNFVGANRELGKLFDFLKSDKAAHQINKFLTMKEIQWHFIPPAAPHFGGLWEAGVKAVKTHLVRVVGQSCLTFEELSTLLCQIEYCVNSRPLHATSGEPDDSDCLTPNHFLIGTSGGLPPDLDAEAPKLNLIRRWRYVQRINNDLWKRWKEDYLRHLQERTKWTTTCENIQVGDVVILKNENTSPATWPLARVVTLHPGADGNTRVVTVTTKGGNLKRPITKLVLLPTSEAACEAS